MLRSRPALCCALLLACLSFLPMSNNLARDAYADDVTPTATDPQTVAPTISVPTPDVVSTSSPAVTREHTKPVVTVVPTLPIVTEAPPTATSRDALPSAATRATPTPATGPQAASGSPSTVDVPLPSPQQLEQSARLRFGTGIPGSVSRWSFLIVPAAKRYGVSPTLLAAVMTMESGGDPLALSGADARGLMQVLHGPWDPRKNVFTGARMLRAYYDEFSDWKLALAAYNAGPNAVLSFNGVPPYRETHDYVIIVSYLWDLYSNHHLSNNRKSLYRSTLRDLQHFARERRKLNRLAAVAGIPRATFLNCSGHACDVPAPSATTASLDPFWPVGDVPDPLQHVDPVGSGT